MKVQNIYKKAMAIQYKIEFKPLSFPGKHCSITPDIIQKLNRESETKFFAYYRNSYRFISCFFEVFLITQL